MKGYERDLADATERQATPCTKPERCDCDDCRSAEYGAAMEALDTLRRRELYCRLSEMPRHLHRAEEHLLHMESGLASAKAHLLLTEDTLLLSGAIDGKNEAARAAQLREQTASSREQVAVLEAGVARARMELRCVQAEFSTAKAMARLLAGGEER
jgi:hypothetical protein